MSEIQKQLKEHLKNGADWEKLETPIAGVWVVKVPAGKTYPARLNLEINPLNANGNPTKKRGLFITDYEMLIEFSEALNADETLKLIKAVGKINPEKMRPKVKKLKM